MDLASLEAVIGASKAARCNMKLSLAWKTCIATVERWKTHKKLLETLHIGGMPVPYPEYLLLLCW